METICDYCGKPTIKKEENEVAWCHDTPTGWICDICKNQSDQAHENDDLDSDRYWADKDDYYGD